MNVEAFYFYNDNDSNEVIEFDLKLGCDCDKPDDDYVFILTAFGPKPVCKNGCRFICPNCLNFTQNIISHKGFFYITACVMCQFRLVPDFKNDDSVSNIVNNYTLYMKEYSELKNECKELFKKRKNDLLRIKCQILLQWELNDGKSFAIFPLEIIERIFNFL